jgi:hypothetical protein
MIIYLGLPRCASSWTYNNLNSTELKETHYLYTNPQDPIDYVKSKRFDFSTNNWSMDSNIATMIDPYIKKYILTVRNPIDLAVSYKSLSRTRQSLDQFIKTLIVNKLLCYGDIIERWYNLVDPSKILIHNYDDILEDNQTFITKLTNQLLLPTPNFISLVKTNRSNNKIYEPLSESSLRVLQGQIAKFEKITNLSLNYAINN